MSIQSVNCVVTTPGGSTSLLPVFDIRCAVEIIAGSAFVTIETSFLNTTESPISGEFQFPTPVIGNVIVSACSVTVPGHVFSTTIIDPDQVKYKEDANLGSISKNIGSYKPSLTTMPFHSCPANAEVFCVIHYVQEMSYNEDGYYEFEVPMILQSGGTYQGRLMNEVLSLDCKLHHDGHDCRWGSNSHSLAVLSKTNEVTTIALNRSAADVPEQRNLHFFYQVSTTTIRGTCLVQPPTSTVPEGAYTIMVTPPTKGSIEAIPRHVIFLIDRSGSMGGQAMELAIRGLIIALDQLLPQEYFGICAFDDREEWFGESPTLVEASRFNIGSAQNWVRQLGARGGTEIMGPYQRACQVLKFFHPSPQVVPDNHGHGRGHGHALPAGFIAASPTTPVMDVQAFNPKPFFAGNTQRWTSSIVLLTDGCVSNEQQIVAFAAKGREQEGSQSIKTHTFGIGPYCNRYFLKMLAFATHGYSDVCLYMEGLTTQLSALIKKTNAPVLSDISFDIVGDRPAFPFCTPDLTQGAPIVVGTSFTGKGPSRIIVRGVDAYGNRREIPVAIVVVAAEAPIYELAARLTIDLLIGNWWLETNSRKKNEIHKAAVATSIHSNQPCVFTVTVAHESPASRKARNKPSTTFQEADKPSDVNNHWRASRPHKGGARHQSGGGVAMIAGGAAVSVGLGIGLLYAFGDLGATSMNTSVTKAMGDLFSQGFSGDVLSSFGSAASGLANSAYNGVANFDYSGTANSAGNAISQGGNAAYNGVANFDYSGTANSAGNAISQGGNAAYSGVANFDYSGAASNAGNAAQSAGGAALSDIKVLGDPNNCCCCTLPCDLCNFLGDPSSFCCCNIPCDLSNCDICGICNICNSCPVGDVCNALGNIVSCLCSQETFNSIGGLADCLCGLLSALGRS